MQTIALVRQRRRRDEGCRRAWRAELLLTAAQLLVAGLLLVFPIRDRSAAAAPAADTLVIFHQGGVSPVDRAFLEHRLPGIRRLAKQMDIAVHLVDARTGSPEEIAVTPLIVYQNHRGRSIYQGRTTTVDRIRLFIRTSRYIPQGEAPHPRERIPVWEIERTRIWAPLKITPLTGWIRESRDPGAFASEAVTAIVGGFEKFELRDRVDLGRADRGFYMDVHPYRSRDGMLYLSLALYSQFDCKKPVFMEKVYGPWRDRSAVFNRGGAVLESAVSRIIRDPRSGDSFDAVAATTPIRTWEEIGLPLPPGPEKEQKSDRFVTEIPRQWTYERPGPSAPPMIQFRFAAPLDSYAGEIKAADGDFILPEALTLDGAGGFIEVDTRSAVTMGNEVLDEVIRGSMMLDAKTYPKSTFVIESIDGGGRRIAFNRLIPARISGTFTLKGKSVPLTCPGEFEMGIGEDEKPRLLLRTAFKIDLRAFDIEGADGPAPARYTLLIDVNFQLKERSEG